MYFNKILECLGSQYLENDIYLLAIQGASCSGKTTLSNKIAKKLNGINIKTDVIHLDDYYISFPFEKDKIPDFNFDSPASFDWNALKATLNAYSKEHSEIPSYKHQRPQRILVGEKIPNRHPKVIILEGLYAFNLLSSNSYDSSKYNLLDISIGPSAPTLVNTFDYSRFKILKIYNSISRDEFYKRRRERDQKTGFASEPGSENRYKNLVWPSTEKWIETTGKSRDIEISEGSYNNECVSALISDLIHYFIPNILEQSENKENLIRFSDLLAFD